MAHVKIQYDVMDAFCGCFQRFGFTKMKSRIISDVFYSQTFMASNPTGAETVANNKGIASGMIKVHAKT